MKLNHFLSKIWEKNPKKLSKIEILAKTRILDQKVKNVSQTLKFWSKIRGFSKNQQKSKILEKSFSKMENLVQKFCNV